MIEFLRSEANAVGELLSVLGLVLVWAFTSWLMWRGFRRRRAAEEPALGALPIVDTPARAPDGEAAYTGTTYGGSQTHRVAAGGLFARGACRYWFERDRLVFQRVRAPAIALTGIRGVGVTGAHAGRVLAPGRIAVVAWTLGSQAVDSGFGFDDADAAEAFADAVQGVAGLVGKER